MMAEHGCINGKIWPNMANLGALTSSDRAVDRVKAEGGLAAGRVLLRAVL